MHSTEFVKYRLFALGTQANSEHANNLEFAWSNYGQMATHGPPPPPQWHQDSRGLKVIYT